MAVHFINIDNEKLKCSLALRELVESYNTKAIGLVDDTALVGIIIYTDTFIHYIYIKEEYRRCGYAKDLIKYVIANIPEPNLLKTAVSISDKEALHLFIDMNFTMQGFRYHTEHTSRSYVMQYVSKFKPNELDEIRKMLPVAVESLMDSIMVVEVLKVRY